MRNNEKVIALLASFGILGLIGMVAISVDVPAHLVWSIYVGFIIGQFSGLIIGKDE